MAYIPNEEIRQEFFQAVKHSGHREIARLVKESDELLQAVLNLNGERAACMEQFKEIKELPSGIGLRMW